MKLISHPPAATAWVQLFQFPRLPPRDSCQRAQRKYEKPYGKMCQKQKSREQKEQQQCTQGIEVIHATHAQAEICSQMMLLLLLRCTWYAAPAAEAETEAATVAADLQSLSGSHLAIDSECGKRTMREIRVERARKAASCCQRRCRRRCLQSASLHMLRSLR